MDHKERSALDRMTENVKRMPLIWYENENGDRWAPPEDWQPWLVRPPESYVYQGHRNPQTLVTEVTRDGERIAGGSKSFPAELVLALLRPTIVEVARQQFRYGDRPALMTFDQAVLAATSCERCMNVWAHRAGLRWGYRVHSPEWHECGTSCEGCQNLTDS
jgi:hypothetical protein